MHKLSITIVGAGYVGLSNACLLAQHNNVSILDINQSKLDLIEKRISPVKDQEISTFLLNKSINIATTSDKKIAYQNADLVIVATPTDYDEKKNYFNTKTVEKTIADCLAINPLSTIIIKSTVPVGFTDSIKQKLGADNIIFSPEFLREGKALYDNLYPSRIIVGSSCEKAKLFADLLKQGCKKNNVAVLHTSSSEAEAIKLFSNTYLAMRVAYFNELDTYAELHNLKSSDIIKGVCLDDRIGDNYNNPSFGYGGYCFPKDTKQLLANYDRVPNALIKAIVKSNATRKDFIVQSILHKSPKTVGIYRLAMKLDSDNFRDSAVLYIIEKIKNNNIKVIIYEPQIKEEIYLNSEINNNLDDFKLKSDIIIANRQHQDLKDANYKVYSRDIFNKD